MDDLIEKIFSGLTLSGEERHLLKEAAVRDFLSTDETLRLSGIVIAGFGRDELFPGIGEILVKGIIKDRLLYKIRFTSSIHHGNGAIIRNYGIQEPVQSFLRGVTKEYQAFSEDSLLQFEEVSRDLEDLIRIRKERLPQEDLLKILLERILDFYKGASQNYLERYYREGKRVMDRHWDQLLKNTATLPKAELAIFAETLLHLTFFKGRGARSPIDILVISKGDGVEWAIQEGKRLL